MKIESLCVSFGEKTIFKDFSCEFEKDTITVILGDSGVGKTTLLNCIAGIQSYTGRIILDGKVSYDFQEPRLIETSTVYENLLYVRGGKGSKQIDGEIDELLKIVGLVDEKHTLVTKLSGGMKSRVALARAFLYPSNILLMDEPFKSLDLGLQISLKNALKQLLRLHPRTVILVTHDVSEAVELGDRVILLKGRPIKVEYEAKKGEDGVEKKLYSLLTD